VETEKHASHVYSDQLNFSPLCPLSFAREESAMDFRPLTETERKTLVTALRGNAQDGLAVLMDRQTTSFLGTAEEVPDEEVINAIRSVPCHY
jgi:hypothetical protein